MDEINHDQNSESGLRKRKPGCLMEKEESPLNSLIQKRRTQQKLSSQLSSDCKKAKEDQLEKYIQDLETKNKLLLAKCTDLSTHNKNLSEENVALHNKLKESDNSNFQNRSVKVSVQQVVAESKTVPHSKVENLVEILSTQAVMDLWEGISTIPLPQCSCSKSQAAVIKRRTNSRTKKYRAHNARI